MQHYRIRQYSTLITRPTNTTAYVAGDIVSNAVAGDVQIVGENEFKSGDIVGARMATNSTNVTNATFRLFLFSDDANLSDISDNSGNNVSVAADADMIGWCDFTLAVTGLNNSSGIATVDGVTDFEMPFRSTDGIHARLVATGSYTPTSAEQIQLTIMVR
jgi:hypothetical protein